MTNKTHALDRRSESAAEACLKVAQVKGLAVLRKTARHSYSELPSQGVVSTGPNQPGLGRLPHWLVDHESRV
jgi:hypothetical protein